MTNEKKYLIALDMDGTLLNSQSQISSTTLAYLHALDQQGHVIVLASGRPLRALKKYHEELKLHSPMVCYNGAFIVSTTDGNFTPIQSNLSLSVVKDILTDISIESLDNIMLESLDDIWLLREDDDLNNFFWHQNLDLIYGNPLLTINEDPMTLILRSKKRSHHHDQVIRDAVAKHPHYKVRFWHDSDYSEVFLDNVSKMEGLKVIADHYGIPHDQTIAFGDAENDIEMLSWAKYGVAMKNANPVCKAHANIIAEYDNDHDGIVHQLKKILKEN